MAFQSLQSLVEKYLNSGDFADFISNSSNGIVGALNDYVDNYFSKNNIAKIIDGSGAPNDDDHSNNEKIYIDNDLASSDSEAINRIYFWINE